MDGLTDDQKFRNAIEAAWSDEEYKARLISEPSKALKEFGIDCPPECSLTVVESSESNRFFVLPPAPDASLSAEEVKAKSDSSDYRALVHVLYNVNCC